MVLYSYPLLDLDILLTFTVLKSTLHISKKTVNIGPLLSILYLATTIGKQVNHILYISIAENSIPENIIMYMVLAFALQKISKHFTISTHYYYANDSFPHS